MATLEEVTDMAKLLAFLARRGVSSKFDSEILVLYCQAPFTYELTAMNKMLGTKEIWWGFAEPNSYIENAGIG